LPLTSTLSVWWIRPLTCDALILHHHLRARHVCRERQRAGRDGGRQCDLAELHPVTSFRRRMKGGKVTAAGGRARD